MMKFTGIPKIDLQHFRLLEKLDGIIYLGQNNGNYAASKLMLSDFTNMIHEHILYEDSIMKSADYFDTVSHSETHIRYAKLISGSILQDQVSFYQNIKLMRISLTAHINLEAEFFKKYIPPTTL